MYKRTLAFAVLLFLFSCQKQADVNSPSNLIDQAREEDEDGPMILGEQLSNPYSLTNMQKAWDSLLVWDQTGITQGVQFNFQATHTYVKFKPQNEEELSALKRDTTIAYYTFPLDYAIVRHGHYYHDPGVAPEMPTFQYAAVPVGKDLPNVSYDVLAQLFIPDEYKDGVEGPLGNNDELIEALVETALILTGHMEEGRLANARGARINNNSKWRPAGYVKVFDNSNIPNVNLPMTGVKVRARRWFVTHTGISGFNGYYQADGQFRRQAEYNLDWERQHFAIRKGWLAGAHFNGPQQRGDWNPIWNHGEQMHYARAFVAAERYYYGDVFGLRRPPMNTAQSPQMKIRNHSVNSPHTTICGTTSAPATHCEPRRFLGLGNQINIYRRPYALEFEGMYSTVIHELAHASHWKMSFVGENFDDCEVIVKETWAVGVETQLTKSVFPDYEGSNGNRRLNRGDFNYTALVEDLIDEAENNLAAGDMVTGYTIRQLEDALQNRTTWHAWADEIVLRYPNNPTKYYVNHCFYYWN
jgi:hypothetical protein